MCKWDMSLEGDPKNVKPFLKNSFLKDFRRRNCGARCVPCAPEFADVARFVEGPLYLTNRSTLLAATQTPLAIAQTGKYKPNAQDLTGRNFVVEAEKRCWLHIAIDRFDGTIVGQQLEEVTE